MSNTPDVSGQSNTDVQYICVALYASHQSYQHVKNKTLEVHWVSFILNEPPKYPPTFVYITFFIFNLLLSTPYLLIAFIRYLYWFDVGHQDRSKVLPPSIMSAEWRPFGARNIVPRCIFRQFFLCIFSKFIVFLGHTELSIVLEMCVSVCDLGRFQARFCGIKDTCDWYLIIIMSLYCPYCNVISMICRNGRLQNAPEPPDQTPGEVIDDYFVITITK